MPAGLFLERDFARLAHGRTIVFYDMRGRGHSSAIDDSTHVSIDLDVADLEALRQHIGAQRFIPLGWSYLGHMVMRYAAAHPEHIDRIVQIAPVGRVPTTRYPDSLVAHDSVPVTDSAAYAELMRLRASGLQAQEPQAYCEREYRVLRARLAGNPVHAAEVPDLCAMANEWPVRLDPHQRWLFTSILRIKPPSWEQFTALTVPVLTIHGTQDRNAPYGGGREWASHLTNGRLLTLRGAAHMAWLDAPDLLYPALDRFLSGGWPPDAVHPPIIDDARAGSVKPSNDTATDICKLERDVDQATVTRDRTALTDLFADEYQHVDYLGGIADRSSELAFLTGQDLTVKGATIDSCRCRLYQGVAVATGVNIWTEASYRGTDLSGSYRFTRVYVLRSGRWQIVASHASKISRSASRQ